MNANTFMILLLAAVYIVTFASATMPLSSSSSSPASSYEEGRRSGDDETTARRQERRIPRISGGPPALNAGERQSGMSENPIRPPPPRPVESGGGGRSRPEMKVHPLTSGSLHQKNISMGGFNLYAAADSGNGGDSPYFKYFSDRNTSEYTVIKFEGFFQTNGSSSSEASGERFNQLYAGNGQYDWVFSEITENSTSNDGIADASTSQYIFSITGYPTSQVTPRKTICFSCRLI